MEKITMESLKRENEELKALLNRLIELTEGLALHVSKLERNLYTGKEAGRPHHENNL